MATTIESYVSCSIKSSLVYDSINLSSSLIERSDSVTDPWNSWTTFNERILKQYELLCQGEVEENSNL